LRALPKSPAGSGVPYRMTTTSGSAFRIPGSAGVARTVLAPLEHLLALTDLERLYGSIRATAGTDEFLDLALERLGIGREVLAGSEHLPRTGPALVVANHPFGAIEGLVLARVLRAVRPDVRIVVNRVLERIPELSELFLFVDAFGGGGSVQRNARTLRAALSWLQQGGMLAMFPAGEVSSLRLGERAVTDPRWNPAFVSLALRARASICPGFFTGRNGALFQLAGLVHPRLRTALLPRELVNKRGARLHVRFGTPITPEELEPLRDDAERSDLCRLRTYALGDPRRRARPRVRRSVPLAPAQPPSSLEAEIALLPRTQRLAQVGELEAWIASAAEIPAVLQEIGRLREQAFRAVGEGAGGACDLDRFDRHYLHLFLWDRSARAIAGGYRLGRADELLARGGPGELYTNTLFEYGPGVLNGIGTALEVGRSFVSPTYQRSYAPLLTLWKGIGAFVVRNPRYRRLFGPVSISADYHPLSRQILGHWLVAGHSHEALYGRVRGRTPPGFSALNGLSPARLRNLAAGGIDVPSLVREIEHGARGVPVLLSEYLKLGGKCLALNVDAGFQDALDALVLVDLVATPRRLLERYLGRDGASAFLAAHAPEERLAS